MVYKFFDKKSSGSDIKSVSNQKLIDELYKPIIEKFKKYIFIIQRQYLGYWFC